MTSHEKAATPADLTRLILERANAADIDGILALYEPDAILYVNGQPNVGTDAIRAAFEAMVAANPDLSDFAPNGAARIVDELALTSSVSSDAITTEVARRQPDGTWLYVIDVTNIVPDGWVPRT